MDYSKILDANGNPIWHTTVLTNGGWDTDYLPILQKDRLVASAAIKDGKLAFSNLFMARYYLVERATGLVLPIDGNGKLYTTGKYPQLNKKLQVIAEKYGVSDNTIAAAWILRHPANMQIVTGTSSESRLKEIIAACDITLTREEWYELYLAAGHLLP